MTTMIQQQPSLALVPQLISRSRNRVLADVLAIAVGVALLSALAQIKIFLPFTPVPITGQTLGISMIGLSWGWRRSMAVIGLYLLIGALGAPVFAQAHGWSTVGYLFGMLVAGSVEGFFADRGFARSFSSAFLLATCGSVIIFSCGLAVLSQFVPLAHLLTMGLLPFLPGDLVKNLISAGFRAQFQKLVKD